METCSKVFKNEEFDFSNEPVVNRKKTMEKYEKLWLNIENAKENCHN